MADGFGAGIGRLTSGILSLGGTELIRGREEQQQAALQGVLNQPGFNELNAAEKLQALAPVVGVEKAVRFVQGTATAPQGTTLQRNVQFIAPGDPEEQRRLAQQSLQRPGVSITTGEETELAKARGKARGAREVSIDEAAIAGREFLDTVGILRQALRTATPGGPLDELEIFVGSVANQLGVNIDIGKLAAKETFKAQTNKLVLPMIKQLGANPSNADREFIISTVAGVGKSTESNEALLDLRAALSLKAIAKQRIKETALDQTGPEFRRTLKTFNDANPLTKFMRLINLRKKAGL